jgi:hypothetical protein
MIRRHCSGWLGRHSLIHSVSGKRRPETLKASGRKVALSGRGETVPILQKMCRVGTSAALPSMTSALSRAATRSFCCPRNRVDVRIQHGTVQLYPAIACGLHNRIMPPGRNLAACFPTMQRSNRNSDCCGCFRNATKGGNDVRNVFHDTYIRCANRHRNIFFA